MEACCTATPQTFFHLRRASVAPSPSSVSFLLKPIDKIKQYPVSSRQFHHPKTPPSRSVASAAPTTAEISVSEKLPADIQVTETPEPNSRVRLSVEVPALVCDDCCRN